jgi:hypothetical protein
VAEIFIDVGQVQLSSAENIGHFAEALIRLVRLAN